jgi:holo-[acyl-carrier protein] synthase
MKGLGVDAVDVARFERALERTPALRSKMFTTAELASVQGRGRDAASLAARFAVREATMKALGVGLGAFDLHDVSVERQSSGQPTLKVVGRAAQLAVTRGISSWHVSITHTETVAVAVVAAS